MRFLRRSRLAAVCVGSKLRLSNSGDSRPGAGLPEHLLMLGHCSMWSVSVDKDYLKVANDKANGFKK
ncbi:hypothetical protein L596_019798 [Steinernema carpocapsae]|uniref:Uncharacterized protein n=1 Tax=Steinernema carpocapsae TaxID=34508 RepID=A0A4U5MRL1_STECR|nr:hypothetical protein L596_019798 [Steinernema carpocapsae]